MVKVSYSRNSCVEGFFQMQYIAFKGSFGQIVNSVTCVRHYYFIICVVDCYYFLFSHGLPDFAVVKK